MRKPDRCSDYPHSVTEWEKMKRNGELQRYYTMHREWKQALLQDTPWSRRMEKMLDRQSRRLEANNHLDLEDYR